jgi:predicted PolB exonuclease-like 3'-5' exonuclease
MKPTVIVWDLETVPGLGGFAAANDLVGKPDVEVREAIGGKSPKHIYHSIICIGALIAHWEPGHWAVDAVGAPHVGERTEKELISAFCDKIAELSPQLVTFNGNSFDLPVLRYRAMVHRVSAPGLSARPYFHRYSEDAIDLCDVFSSFSPQGKPSAARAGRCNSPTRFADIWKWRPRSNESLEIAIIWSMPLIDGFDDFDFGARRVSAPAATTC